MILPAGSGFLKIVMGSTSMLKRLECMRGKSQFRFSTGNFNCEQFLHKQRRLDALMHPINLQITLPINMQACCEMFSIFSQIFT